MWSTEGFLEVGGGSSLHPTKLDSRERLELEVSRRPFYRRRQVRSWGARPGAGRPRRSWGPPCCAGDGAGETSAAPDARVGSAVPQGPALEQAGPGAGSGRGGGQGPGGGHRWGEPGEAAATLQRCLRNGLAVGCAGAADAHSGF